MSIVLESHLEYRYSKVGRVESSVENDWKKGHCDGSTRDEEDTVEEIVARILQGGDITNGNRDSTEEVATEERIPR